MWQNVGLRVVVGGVSLATSVVSSAAIKPKYMLYVDAMLVFLRKVVRVKAFWFGGKL